MKLLAGTIKASGHFSLVVSEDAEGSRVKAVVDFDNLITDAGLERFCSLSTGTSASNVANFQSLFGGFAVGSGSTPPTVSDTTLVSQITYIGVQSVVESASWENGYYQIVARSQYGQGVAAGNLSEVGIRNGASGPLWSRALIEDVSGNPTTITVLPTDFLTVEYTLRFMYPVEDGGHTINVMYDGNPVETLVTTRVGSANTLGNARWSTRLRPSGNSRSSGFSESSDLLPAETNVNLVDRIPTYPGYVPGSREIWLQMYFGLGDRNGQTGRITTADLFGQWQFAFNPPIVKDNTQEMVIRLGIKMERA